MRDRLQLREFLRDGRDHVAFLMVEDEPGVFVHVGDPEDFDTILLEVRGNSVAYVYGPDDLLAIGEGASSVPPVVIPVTANFDAV